jgi:hypothetical protein
MPIQSPAPTISRPAAGRPWVATAPARRHDGFHPPRRAGFSLPVVHEVRRAPVRDDGTW